ncbi:hypothetical protein L2E82_35541 [Cichorium intybus]|uniref:Uncharacterized protein n=1 Tax=Cichorium intybus TaxID=13427 RepID=A0ACB9BP52_CICIN|nr:hypothetical protein L2E82_35541 [Cichorium intybus]
MSVRLAGYPCSAEDSRAVLVLSYRSQAFPVPSNDSQAIPVPPIGSRAIPKERPGRRLDGVAGSFQHFSLSENPTTRSQVIGLVTVLAFKLPSAHLLTL